MTQNALIKELAEKLATALKERKVAQRRAADAKNAGVSLSEQQDDQYWTAIAKAQIDIIGITCGRDSLMKVHDALEYVEGNAEYNYRRGFSTCADGLHGWYK